MTAHQFTPRFYAQFQCIGDQCEDNCCHGWHINIDKKTYRHYLAHPDPLIQHIAADSLTQIRRSNEEWASIDLDDTGHCPFLSEGLCQIHKRAGAQDLSLTCQSYPRVSSRLGSHHKLSLALSCPEACRQVLLDPAAMVMEVTPFKGYYKEQILPPLTEQLHSHILDVLLASGMSVEEKLWVIGLLIHRDPAPLSHDAFLAQIGQLVEAGQLSGAFAQLPFISQVQWSALHHLTCLQVVNARARAGRGLATMQRCLEQIQRLLSGDFNTGQLAQLHEVWHHQVAPFLAARPHILHNYLVYYVYHHHFPYHPERTPQQCYQLLIADYFLLRSYLCLLAMENKLSEQDIVDLFYSYHSLRQHNGDYEAAIARVLSEGGEHNDVALYALLQTAVAPATAI